MKSSSKKTGGMATAMKHEKHVLITGFGGQGIIMAWGNRDTSQNNLLI